MLLMDTIIRPMVLYCSSVWGHRLIEFDLAEMERVQPFLH
jgi:hypothetical protein